MVLHLGPLRVGEHAASRCRRPASCVPQNDTNKRGEIKLTGTVAPSHTIQGGYLNNPRDLTNSSGLHELHHRSAQRGRSRATRTGTTTRTTRAC